MSEFRIGDFIANESGKCKPAHVLCFNTIGFTALYVGECFEQENRYIKNNLVFYILEFSNLIQI